MSVVNAKTGTGAGIGAAIGFFLGGGPIGAGIGALLGGMVAHKTGAPKGVMTPKRKLVYARAMGRIKDPADLKALADSFAGEGLHAEAAMLRKRAGLRELPPEVAEQRRLVFRRAMASDNATAIRDVAAQFAAAGSTDAAKILHGHAIAVEAARAAGAAAKPVDMKTLEAFADKLARAIGHFGPDSKQAMSAARNLILAQGKVATTEAVEELLAIAQGTLQEDAAERAAAAAKIVEKAPDAEAEAPAAKPARPPATIAVESHTEPATKVRVDVDRGEEPEEVMQAAGVSNAAVMEAN